MCHYDRNDTIVLVRSNNELFVHLSTFVFKNCMAPTTWYSVRCSTLALAFSFWDAKIKVYLMVLLTIAVEECVEPMDQKSTYELNLNVGVLF